MNIDTTIYIKKEYRNRLNSTSEILGISRNKVVELLIDMFIDKNKFSPKMFETVQYQEKADKNAWSTIHIWLQPTLYENCLDIRKIYKISVSFMIAFAVDNYLDNLTGRNSPATDNYIPHSRNYIFVEQDCEGTRLFSTFWGFPGQEYLEKYLL